MSWRDAPLYVRVADLAQDLARRVDARPEDPYPHLRSQISDEALGLLRAVTLALSFPSSRASALEQADHRAASLRVLVVLGAELGVLSHGGARRAGEELAEIGRMIGGWRRRKPGPTITVEPVSSGAEPPPA